MAVEQGRSADDRRVVPEGPIAVQLEEAREDEGHEIEGARPLGMARQLDASPGGLDRLMAGGSGLDHR
jgi:hypothetical protein